MKIKVYIADDHVMFRDGMRALLQHEKDLEVVGDADSEEGILGDCAELRPNVILMDIDMGESNGIEITKKLVSLDESLRVLAVSMHGESKYVTSMMEAGAHGYILKNAGRAEILAAIRTVHSGATYLSRQVSSVLLEGLGKPKSQKKEGIPLTAREIEVLKLIAEECSNQEIAEMLFISVRTVDTHRRNLLEKLGVKNTAGLVKYAIKNGLIDED